MKGSSSSKDQMSRTEKTIVDYILKHNHRIRISECASDLGLSLSEVDATIKSLNARSVLNVFQRPVGFTSPLYCAYLKNGKCLAVQSNISLRQKTCKNAIMNACCYQCQYCQSCSIACDLLGRDQTPSKRQNRIPSIECHEVADDTESTLGKNAMNQNLRKRNCQMPSQLMKHKSLDSAREKVLTKKKECGNCAFFLSSKCPRKYPSGNDLWRRQVVCDLWKMNSTRA